MLTDEQYSVLTSLADKLEAGRLYNGVATDNAETYALALRAALASLSDQKEEK